MPPKTIQWLRKDEWTMGNGQCPDCCGCKPGGWVGHPCVPTSDYEGHEKGCPRAESLEELGEKVQYIKVKFGKKGMATLTFGVDTITLGINP